MYKNKTAAPTSNRTDPLGLSRMYPQEEKSYTRNQHKKKKGQRRDRRRKSTVIWPGRHLPLFLKRRNKGEQRLSLGAVLRWDDMISTTARGVWGQRSGSHELRVHPYETGGLLEEQREVPQRDVDGELAWESLQVEAVERHRVVRRRRGLRFFRRGSLSANR